jgi:5,10-methenyltetrahydrofolate synthetase
MVHRPILPLCSKEQMKSSGLIFFQRSLSTHAAGGLDLIVVPGLAFTVKGHRLGRGKGYYDVFLDKCRKIQGTPPLTVGLAFSQQVVPHVPTDKDDICVDHVLYST